MKILFEDKKIIAALKPAGIPSQKDKSGQKDMTEYLREQCKCDIFVVHRLDTATAGVIFYAKTSEAAGRLTSSLAEGEKYYLAAVAGSAGAGEMRDFLFHDKLINKSYVVERERKGAKEAILRYETLEENDGLSLVRVRLITGRTHQIRVQFASRGMPLAGDGKYGSKIKSSLALFCSTVKLFHPYSGEEICVSSLPESPFSGFDLSV